MSDVTVSISLTRKQQGELYMQNMRRGTRINAILAELRRIEELAIAAGNFEISVAAKAARDPKIGTV